MATGVYVLPPAAATQSAAFDADGKIPRLLVASRGERSGNGRTEGELCGIAWLCEESNTVENVADAAG